jgi:hypothetical protein
MPGLLNGGLTTQKFFSFKKEEFGFFKILILGGN